MNEYQEFDDFNDVLGRLQDFLHEPRVMACRRDPQTGKTALLVADVLVEAAAHIRATFKLGELMRQCPTANITEEELERFSDLAIPAEVARALGKSVLEVMALADAGIIPSEAMPATSGGKQTRFDLTAVKAALDRDAAA